MRVVRLICKGCLKPKGSPHKATCSSDPKDQHLYKLIIKEKR